MISNLRKQTLKYAMKKSKDFELQKFKKNLKIYLKNYEMKQVFYLEKELRLKEVPEPIVEKGKILIKNLYSCVSPGTEISSLNSIKKNILKK